jgi:predicted secreted Zn-dependent protease
LKVRDLLVAVLFLCSTAAYADVREKLTQSQYEVRGNDHSSLLSLLNAATPIVFEGKKYHAFTSWNVHWNFRWFAEPDGRCRITSAAIDLTANMRLPNLVGGSTQQRQAFYPYLSALQTHEFGHYQLGKEAADAIDRGIQRLPSAASCRLLERDANTLGYRLLADYQARERQYDQSTGYGKTQGASLQP